MWKDIIGFKGLYQVSDKGEIKSLARQKGFINKLETIRKQKTTKFGYKTIALCKNNKMKHYSIHRLVAIAFIPNVSKKKYINHIDGNKLNNHFVNLEWVTASENAKHCYKIGLRSMIGDNHNNRKLSSKDVVKILKSKKRNIDLVKKYNVSPSTICQIRKRKCWKSIKI